MRRASAILLLALLPVACERRRPLTPFDASPPEHARAHDGSPPTDAGRPDATARDDAGADRADSVDAHADARPGRPDTSDAPDASEADPEGGVLGGVRMYRARLLPAPLPNGVEVPELALTLTLIPEAPGTPAVLVASIPGAAAQGEATRGADGSYSTRTQLSLPDPTFTDPCMPARYVLAYVDVTLDANGLSGHALGTHKIDEGDYVSSHAFTATLIGVRDTDAPTITLAGFDPPAFGGGISPLGSLHFVASKALRAGTTATLRGTDGSTKALVPEVSAPGAVVGFTSDDGALKFGGAYDLMITPALVDLAGDVGRPSVRVETTPDPGALDDGGFEGAVAAVGSTRLVFTDGIYLPPITGQRSLVLAPSAPTGMTVVMRVKVQRPDALLRFRFRAVSQPPDWGTGTLQVRVAIPGGPSVSSAFPAWEPGDTPQVVSTPSGPETLGPVHDVAVALPAGAAREVFVELRLPFVCEFPSVFASLVLVDDLRVE